LTHLHYNFLGKDSSQNPRFKYNTAARKLKIPDLGAARQLRKRGVDKVLAAKTAGSGHGPWRLAESPALHIALPNAYFDSLGIPRLTVG
jgi:hypothetical protein